MNTLAMEETSRLPEAVLEQMTGACVRWNIAGSRQLLFQGQTSDTCFCVAYGLVELSVCTPEGATVVADVLGAGEWFGFSHVLAQKPSSWNATSLGTASLLVLRRSQLQRLMAHHAEVQPWLRDLSVAQADRLLVRLAMLTTQGVDERLQWLLEQHGEQIWRAKLTQTDLARLVGSSRQRVNEALGRWRHARTGLAAGPAQSSATEYA